MHLLSLLLLVVRETTAANYNICIVLMRPTDSIKQKIGKRGALRCIVRRARATHLCSSMRFVLNTAAKL